MVDTLREHLARELPGEDAPLEFERIGEGHSNITYLVRRGSDRFVLRRPPRPPLPPSAHDVLREWRILDAIKDTPARSPRTLLACDDESVIGAPFYVMEYVEGTVITSEIPGCARHAGGAAADGPRPRRRARGGARRGLARMRPRGLRQADRLPRAPGDAASPACGSTTRPASCRACRRCATGSPPTCPSRREATIVHGDYRLGNTMVAERCARARDRDLRLGAVDDRRPARGPRLPDRHVGPAGRPGGHDVQLAVGGHAAARASRRATS